MKRTIFLAADHGGFDLKNTLKEHLANQGHEVVDLGPSVYDEGDDYPDFVLMLIREMRGNDMGVGILACRSAQGVAIAANRNPGVRAAVVWNEEEAKKSRQHNNANVLCLSGDNVSTDRNLSLTDTWLATEFSKEPRHARRLRKIEQYFPL